MNEVRIDLGNPNSSDGEYFDEDFFESLARRGVRSFEFCTCDGVEVDAKTLIAFGFPKNTKKGDRRIAGINLSADLLAELRKVIFKYSSDRTNVKLVVP